MSPMLIAIPPEKLLPIAVITGVAALFTIGTGLVMAVTGKAGPRIPFGEPAPPDRVRRDGAGLALIGVGVALLASGMYTSFGNVESLPFFGVGLVVLLGGPRQRQSRRFTLVAFVVTFVIVSALYIGLWWALSLYLRQ